MKFWVGCARGVQVAYFTLHHRGRTLVSPSTWAKRLPMAGAKPSPDNMPVSWYNVQDIQQVFWARAEGIERQTRPDLLKRTW